MNTNTDNKSNENNQPDEPSQVGSEESSFHQCDINEMIKNECLPCFTEAMESRSNLSKLLHFACREKKYKFMDKFCQLPDNNLKSEIFNSVINDLVPLQVCIENEDLIGIDKCLRQLLVDIFKIGGNKISSVEFALKLFLEKDQINNQLNAIDNDEETYATLADFDYEPENIINEESKQALIAFTLLLFKTNSMVKSITANNEHLNPDHINYKYFCILMKIFSQAMIKAIDKSNYKALHLMMSTGTFYQKIVEFPDFHLPVFAAAFKGDIKIIKMMIKYGTPFNIAKKLNQIPAQILCAKGFLTCLKIVISNFYLKSCVMKNADVQSVNESITEKSISDSIFQSTLDTKMNLLHFAALNNHPNTLKYLLSLDNADKFLNNRNKNGSTPLLCASSKGNIECVKILLQQENIDLLISDVKGNTVIIYATYYDRKDVAMELLKAISLKLTKLSNDIKNNEKLIDKLVMEKRKWLILDLFDSKKNVNNLIDIKSFQLDERNAMNKINQNIQQIKNSFALHKMLNNYDKFPTLEIKIDNFERGSGVLRQWLHNVANFYGAKFMFKPIFDYNDLQPSFTHDCEEKQGYQAPINLKEHFLYLPYFTNVMELEIYQMRNFGTFLAFAMLYSRVHIPLSPVFFKVLLGEELQLFDVMPTHIVKTTNSLSLFTEKELEDIDLDFTVKSFKSDGTVETFELLVGGSDVKVTKDNINAYKSCLKEFYFKSGGRETLLDAFREGFYDIIPFEKIQNFTCSELIKLTICAPQTIPFDQWKKYTKINYTEEGKPIDTNEELVEEIEWFWDYLSQLETSKQLKLIEFFSGSPFLPIGNFKTLRDDNYPFNLTFDTNRNDKLPWATTCTYTLHLSKYSSKEVLFEKFDYVLEHFDGFQFV